MTDRLTTLLVLVPKDGTRPHSWIDRGSGIVAADEPGDTLITYFEGNRYGADNLRTFDERVCHAAGRLAAHYPTIALGRYARSDFDVVGTYTFSADGREKTLTITDQAALIAWTER